MEFIKQNVTNLIILTLFIAALLFIFIEVSIIERRRIKKFYTNNFFPEDIQTNLDDNRSVSFENEQIEDVEGFVEYVSLDVDEGAGIINYPLKRYWKKIKTVLEHDFNFGKYALLEKDEDGLFSVVKNVGFSFDTVENMKFTEFDPFYSNFFKFKKSLYINDNIFENEILNDCIAEQDKENIGEILFFPLSTKKEIIAILCCARRKGLPIIDVKKLNEKILSQAKEMLTMM